MTKTVQQFPKEGTRVRLTKDVERYPHFTARKGAKGTVTESGDGTVMVLMDEPIKGCEDWDNEVIWSADLATIEEFYEQTEILTEAEDDGWQILRLTAREVLDIEHAMKQRENAHRSSAFAKVKKVADDVRERHSHD